jgi:hypothetical protein
MKHTLQELIIEFKKDAERSLAAKEAYIQAHNEDYPGQPLPEFINLELNVPEALATMCEHIIALESKIV